jgi:hypothetical protein
MKAVTLVNANTNYNLLVLMQAVDPRAPIKCHVLQLQFDPAAGSAKLRITNQDGSDTNWGVYLVGTQAFQISSIATNSIPTGSYWLRSSIAGKLVGVFALVT